MERRISWNSGALDEIELIYEKAEKNETAGKLLERLEEKALREVKENCSMFKDRSGKSLTPEDAEKLPMSSKEAVIKALGATGILAMEQDIPNAVLTVRLSPIVQTAMGCTVFGLLNRLEKLDGALNAVYAPKWKLRLLVPLGGREGLFQWEMLIMTLYPWLSVSDEAVNGALPARPAAPSASTSAKPAAPSASAPAGPASPASSASPEAKPAPSDVENGREKKSLWKNCSGSSII